MALAWGAAADTAGANNFDTTLTRSWTSENGTNAYCVVCVPLDNGGSATVSSISWQSKTFTRLSGTPAGTDLAAEIWGAPLGASYTAQTGNLVITFSANTTSNAIIRQVNGASQTSADHHGGAGLATTETTAPSITVTSVATTEFLIGCFCKADGANTYSWGGSATEIAQLVLTNSTTRRVGVAYRTGVSGSQAISATISNTYVGGAAVALVEAAGAGASVVPVLMAQYRQRR